MKREIKFIGIASIVLLLLTMSLYSGRESLSQSPLAKNFPLKNISCITADDNKNIYMIVESRKSVLKINPSGVLQYKLQGEDKKQLYLFSELAVDQQGYLYVLRTDLDTSGLYVVSEKIMRYKPGGKMDRVVYQVDYQGEKRPLRTGHIKYLKVNEKSLVFDYVENDTVLLKTLNKDGKELENRIITYLPPESYLSEITGVDPGAIFFSSQKGEINRIGLHGQLELIYPEALIVPALDNKPTVSSAETDSTPEKEAKKTFPTRVKPPLSNKLYFIDTFANEIRYLNLGNSRETRTVFSQLQIKEQGFDLALTVLKDLVIADDGALTIATRDQIIWVDAQGKITKVLQQGIYPARDISMNWGFWLQLLLAIALLVFLIRSVYINLMGRRASLILKQMIIITPIIVLAMVLLSVMIYRSFAATDEQEVFRKLETITKIGQNRVNVQNLVNIKSPRDFMNEDYRALRELTIEAQMNVQSKGNRRLVDEGLYSAIYKLEDGKLYAIMDYDNSVNMYRPISIAGEFEKVIKSGQIVKDQAMDENGNWMFAMGPLYDKDGSIIGIYETGVDRSGFLKSRKALFQKIAEGIAGITIVIVFMFVFVTYYFLSPVRVLNKSVGEMASGNWEAAVTIDTGDEVADLGDRFNVMAEYIRNYIDEITRLNEAYFRFVPQQFLNYLGKGSILEVQLGDQVKEELIIFSSQIRAFNKMTEGMTPEDSFSFINAYLKRVGPLIRNNGGLIDKYSASGITALFPNQAEDALIAALQLLGEIDEYNMQRQLSGYKVLDIGIGIHMGPLMLGIIGEEQRMEGTLISENVNVARSLERLSKVFAARILISEDILNAVEYADHYQYRSLGPVRVEGKDEPIKLFDLFHGDQEDIRKVKLETRELFEEGISLYQQGSFYEARSCFVEVIKQNRQDEIARIYFFLCEEYSKNDPPKDWNGTLIV
ncbi:MAG: adenylate/guanylate cyclase domain-containing protein [Syntrophomonadaceae bacterium]|nr:adenylate/guanylate cyclase domain-containing protein [Syntrophomonadaceae bacterium]